MSTIKDVAREAGVAVGTVSRYLNGADIKETNRKKIEEAIKKLDFKLNPIARCLKTNKTNTIGVIIPSLTDIYGTTIVRSIEQKLYEFGYNIFVCDSWGDKQLENEKVDLLAHKMVDGLIIYPCSEDLSYLEKLQMNGIPVVTIDLAAKNLNCDQVLTDNINATYSAVEWLINNRHRRIGIINGNEQYFTASERLKGYIRALEDYSIDIDRELITTLGYCERSGYEAMAQLMKLKNPPTAVLACNYYTTIGAIKAIYDMNIKLPDQLSFIGFDNLGLSEVIRPSLSIIVQPMDDIGTRAAELLLSRINGDMDGFPAVCRLKTELILRESSREL